MEQANSQGNNQPPKTSNENQRLLENFLREQVESFRYCLILVKSIQHPIMILQLQV